MTEIMRFLVPLENLAITIEEERPDVPICSITGTKEALLLPSLNATMQVKAGEHYNYIQILDIPAWQRIAKEMASLHPQEGKVYSSSVLESAKRRHLEIIIREVEA